MKIPFVNRRGQADDPPQVESRSYTDDLVAQAFANATEPQSAPGALAVVESCTSLISTPLMVASVTGYAISGGTLLSMGRDLLRLGNSVWMIDLAPNGQVQLLRASAFEVAGRSSNPARWSYALEIETPSGQTVKRTSPAAGVIHIMGDTPPGRSWRGNAPWQSAGLTSSAMAEIERGVREESRLPSGRVWTAPDGASADQQLAMARTIGALKGGKQVVGETVAKGLGQGALAAPRSDWTPVKVGQEHTLATVGMRESMQASIASAYGVPPLWFSPRATGTAVRESKRLSFLNATLPLSKAIADELSLKLDTPISIGWPNLANQSVDIHLRSRGVLSLVQAGVPSQDALIIAGLDGVVIANQDDNDFRIAPRIPPNQYPQDTPDTPDPEGRGSTLLLSHLVDGKVIKEHAADSPCDLCSSRTNGQTNGQTNGRMEYRNS